MKQTEIGLIPEDWYIVKVGEVVTENLYGPRFSSKLYDINGNVKTIRGTDVTPTGKIKYSSVPTALLEEEIIKNHRLLHNDLVVVTTAECGLSVIFEKQDIDFIPSAYMVRYRLNLEKIYPHFIHSLLFTQSL